MKAPFWRRKVTLLNANLQPFEGWGPWVYGLGEDAGDRIFPPHLLSELQRQRQHWLTRGYEYPAVDLYEELARRLEEVGCKPESGCLYFNPATGKHELLATNAEILCEDVGTKYEFCDSVGWNHQTAELHPLCPRGWNDLFRERAHDGWITEAQAEEAIQGAANAGTGRDPALAYSR